MKSEHIVCSIRMDRELHDKVMAEAKADSRTFASMVIKVLKDKFYAEK